uniref:Chondroitin proteoglycan 4 domain-containing protein n=1 Tax=Plectus sambesii TaxID=2011161 RepID=A0A914WWT2_9BILA
MSGTFGLALTAVLLVGVSGNSMFTSLQNMNSPCFKKCVDNGGNVTQAIDFSNTTNYGKQLGDLDNMCTSMAKSRDCVAKCNVPFNPFDMKTMRAMCSKDRRADFKKHSVCYKEQANATHERCNKMCGSMEKMAGDMQGKIVSTNRTNGFNLSALFDSLGGICTIGKCHARCSRDSFNELCGQSDPTAGSFMQQFTEEILTAMNEDFNQFGMRKMMNCILPKECHYMFNPAELFSETETTSSESSNEEVLKSLSSLEKQHGKESKTYQSEKRLLEEKERNLNKAIEKLNLELVQLKKKLAA